MYSKRPTRGGPSAWGLGVNLTAPFSRKYQFLMKWYAGPWTLTDSLQQPKQRKIEVRYKTVILPLVLCGCDTWALIFMEEHGLRAFRTGFCGEYLERRGEK
jgi:hypothetical protein